MKIALAYMHKNGRCTLVGDAENGEADAWFDCYQAEADEIASDFNTEIVWAGRGQLGAIRTKGEQQNG